MGSTPTRRWLALTAAVALACATLVSAAPRTASAADPPGTTTSKVLVKGAAIHGANGLAIDQKGRLLVASVWGREIRALDRTTGSVLKRYGPTIGGKDLGAPDDVAVAPDGSICWTDILGGYVRCLRTDGTVDEQLVHQGVNPIAFTPDGRLFVGLAFFGDALYELDPDLVQAPRVVLPDSGIPPWIGQLNGFDFGPDGLLYSPRPFSGDIVRIDVDAVAPAVEIVASGLTAGSVEFDSKWRLHASLLEGDIVRINTTTGAVKRVASLGFVLDNMVFDSRDRLYVSGSDDGRVVRVLKSGRVRVLSQPGLILPGGIAAVGGGTGGGDRLYVADLWSMGVYDGRTGRFVSQTNQNRTGGGITESWTVAADGKDVILTSWMSNLVQIWDPVAATEVQSWADFAVPVNAIRFGEDLIVAELGTGSVVRQALGGARSTAASGLNVPSGLAATGDDLWVADWASGIVWQIVADGAPVMVKVAMGLANPEGLAVDRDGSLLVVESGAGRLTRIMPSGATRVIAKGLPLGAPAAAGTPPAWMFNGVAVGPSGAIYVTTDETNGVWRITTAPR